MRKYASTGICLGLVSGLFFFFRIHAPECLEWQNTLSGRAALDLLKGFPYLCFGISALWAARISNTPVYVLSLILIPAQYYFSGGTGILGLSLASEQMRFVLFMILPLIVTIASFVSHRTLAATLKTGLAVLIMGFITPPLISALFGRWIVSWVGMHRWTAAGWLGAPSSPTVFYLAVLALNLFLPFGGREGQMKKILASLICCFYFSGVFRPIFQSGPLFTPGLEELHFVMFTSAAALLTLYSNIYLSWSKAYVDDLTQVMARRALNETFGRLSGAFAVAMVDVDHFKKFNDTYGHAAGDLVLKEVAAVLAEHTGGDVYRYGGEEFAVVFPNLDANTAWDRMDRTRKILAETKIPLNGTGKSRREKKVGVQFSAGISESGKKHASPEDVLHAADQALYKAKENGRNRVERG